MLTIKWIFFINARVRKKPQKNDIPDSKVHGANMGHTWVLSSPGGLHVGPINLAIRDVILPNGTYYIACSNHDHFCFIFSASALITWFADHNEDNYKFRWE